MGCDLAVEGRHDALRQVVAFELVVGGELAQGGGGGHDSADPPLDQPLVGELAQAFAFAARADGGGVDDRQAARALSGQPSLLEGGDDFLVDAGQTEAGERDRVTVFDERGGLRRADCLGHRRSFGRSASSAQQPGSAWDCVIRGAAGIVCPCERTLPSILSQIGLLWSYILGPRDS